ncbi:CHAF1B (predicted), partial [Pycnogonum litorale]
EAAIIIWKLGEKHDIFNESTDDNKENWVVYKMLRGHIEDIYDLSWSSCSNFLISGSVDNTAIMWDVNKGKSIGMLSAQNGFVQGVTWDPQNNYIATLSTDRSCRIYNINSRKVIHRIKKANVPLPDSNDETKSVRLYHDDTLKSFCRRLTFSPDGELLITPSGILELDNGETVNATYIFSRTNLTKPAVYLPTKNKYSVAVRCCPVLFQLRPIGNPDFKDSVEDAKPWEKYATVFSLPYRIVFAVATQDSVIIYDTQQVVPIAHISNCHYTCLSDLAWSEDGRMLLISSTDGYCSMITFDENELGTPYVAIDDVKQCFKMPDTKKTESVIPANKVNPVNKVELPVVVDKPKNDSVETERTRKRIQLITLSSPKNSKQPSKKSDTVDDPHGRSYVSNSGALSSNETENPSLPSTPVCEDSEIKSDAMEEPSDIKLVLEPSSDGFNLQRIKNEDENCNAGGRTSAGEIPTKNVDNKAPRRVQLITLSSKSK